MSILFVGEKFYTCFGSLKGTKEGNSRGLINLNFRFFRRHNVEVAASSSGWYILTQKYFVQSV
jgi:hypothetical protein